MAIGKQNGVVLGTGCRRKWSYLLAVGLVLLILDAAAGFCHYRCEKIKMAPVIAGKLYKVWDRKVELNMGFRDFLSRTGKRQRDDERIWTESENKNNRRRWQKIRQSKKFAMLPFVRKKQASTEKLIEVISNEDSKMDNKTIYPESKNKFDDPESDSRTDLPEPKGPVRMGEDPITREVDVPSILGGRRGEETIQQRINRVKAGHMTDSEKKAFLQTALTAGNTVESRKPIVYRSNETVIAGSGATPFPTDSILRDFARGNKNTGRNASQTNNIIDNQDNRNSPEKKSQKFEKAGFESLEQKRRYVEMVTDPNRFGSFFSGYNPKEVKAGQKNQTINAETVSRNESLNSENVNTTKNDDLSVDRVAKPDLGLGSRLGAAALAQEKINAKNRRSKNEEEQTRRLDATRKASKMNDVLRRATKASKQNALKYRTTSLRGEKDAQTQNQQKSQRKKSLMQAQEDYWARQVLARREAKAAQDEQFSVAENIGEVLSHNETAKGTGSLLNETNVKASGKTNDQSREQSIGNRTGIDSVDSFSSNGSKDVEGSLTPISNETIASPEDFKAIQAKKKALIDEAREKQYERLKSFSSPIPRKNEQKKKTTSISPSEFKPQFPISTKPLKRSTTGLLADTINKTARMSNDKNSHQNGKDNTSKSKIRNGDNNSTLNMDVSIGDLTKRMSESVNSPPNSSNLLDLSNKNLDKIKELTRKMNENTNQPHLKTTIKPGKHSGNTTSNIQSITSSSDKTVKELNKKITTEQPPASETSSPESDAERPPTFWSRLVSSSLNDVATISNKERGKKTLLTQQSVFNGKQISAKNDNSLPQQSASISKQSILENNNSLPHRSASIGKQIPVNNANEKKVAQMNKSLNQNQSNNKKGPIRMVLPLDDIQDDGSSNDEKKDFSRMTIAEVTRKRQNDNKNSENPEDRSKKWGVDMSKFL